MLLGLTVPQIILCSFGVINAVVLATSLRSAAGFVAGIAAVVVCALLAFLPVGGRPASEFLRLTASFVVRRSTGRSRWLAPVPLLTGSAGVPPARAARAGRRLPACLAELELLSVARPDWAVCGRELAAVGLIRDRRLGTWTAVMTLRGGQFSLLDPAAQHQRLADWATVLSQFAREASPVVRLGWSLWSASAPLTEHLEWLDRGADMRQVPEAPLASQAEADYRGLLDAAAPTVLRQDLRAWVTIDPRRLARRRGRPPDLAASTLAAARALADRCRAAGLVGGTLLSPVDIAEALRVQADPAVVPAMARVRKGLAEHAGLSSVLCALEPLSAQVSPLAVEARWDAVRVDGAWHRVFWVAGWPAQTVDPRWLEPLLLAPPCVRTVAVLMEPISLRVSRRRINSQSVSIEGQVRLRERHAFRVPVDLQKAHIEVDRREAELQAGFSEYAFLALVAVTGHDREELDANSHAVVDQAAQCGITELRPLYGQQDLAWACTLPIGRVPARTILDGG
jgi:hypothetical protein